MTDSNASLPKRNGQTKRAASTSGLGKRAEQARKLQGLSLESASKLIGVTPATIHKVEKGRIKKPTFIFEMADAYHVSSEWLRFGEERSAIIIMRGKTSTEIEDAPKYPSISYFVPIFSWDNIQIPYNGDNLQSSGHMDFAPLLGNGSLNTFCLKIESNSMFSPYHDQIDFRKGDTIYIDPSMDPYEGCYVLIKSKDYEEPTLRQYIKESGSIVLKPLNPQYPVTRYTQTTKILGVCYYKTHEIKKPFLVPHLVKKELLKNKTK